MVARTPLKERRLAMALDPNLVREAVKKVDKCMARLQELQYTVTGGTKIISGVTLSPRSTRGYLRTSLRCKQESIRLKNSAGRKSPVGKFQGSLSDTGDWQRMSIPARILGETVGEILQASQFAKEISSKKPKTSSKLHNVPRTPDSFKRNIRKKPHYENTELRAKRIKEKQSLNRTIHSELGSPPLARARSRITFKSNSPLKRRDGLIINRVSPKNKPWAKKTVMFPNPIFASTSSPPPSKKFYKTKSPITVRTTKQKSPPHKFVIKSPSTSLKSHMKSKKAVPTPIVFSPVEKKLASAKVRRCSFSPSKLASRLVSPLRDRISLQKSSSNVLMSGLKQRPIFSTPVKISSVKRV